MQMTHLLTREVRSKALGNRTRGRARERHRECSSARSPDHSAVAIGSNSLFEPQHGPTRMWCYAPATRRSSLLPNARSKSCWSECGEHNQVAESRPLTAKTGVRVEECGLHWLFMARTKSRTLLGYTVGVLDFRHHLPILRHRYLRSKVGSRRFNSSRTGTLMVHGTDCSAFTASTCCFMLPSRNARLMRSIPLGW